MKIETRLGMPILATQHASSAIMKLKMPNTLLALVSLYLNRRGFERALCTLVDGGIDII